MARKKLHQWGVADFETTTDPNDCRVWAYAIWTPDSEIEYGNSIEGFMEKLPNYRKLYFYNLKFDSSFIIDYLLKQDYPCFDTGKRNLPDYGFTVLRSDDGPVYSVTIKHPYGTTEIWDALKKIPSSVSRIAKDLKFEEQKLEIDYNAYRAPGHKLTPEEIEYIKNDVTIVGKALQGFMDTSLFDFSEVASDIKLTHMTIGGDAIDFLKKTIGLRNWNRYFPPLNDDVDSFLRKGYYGGMVWVKPELQGKDLGCGLVYDNNSMHPSQLRNKPMPFGEPVYYEGGYIEDELYPLYFQHLKVTATVKPNHIPNISLKRALRSSEAEYLRELDDAELWITSVDLETMFEQYDIHCIEYIDGYKFAAIQGMFNKYIDFWMHVKATSKGIKRMIAKLMLNNIYGKFGTRPEQLSVVPYLEDGKVCYRPSEAPVNPKYPYLPVAVFTTAYSRQTLVRAGQSVYDRLVYMDTDSLHITGLEIPEGLDIHDTEIGKWKLESRFTRARFLRCKRYIEEIDGKLNVKCGGMSDKLKEKVTWENFHAGETFEFNLRPKIVPGGCVLVEQPFHLK